MTKCKLTTTGNMFLNFLCIIIIGMLIICVYDLIVYEPNLSNAIFTANSKYADVVFTADSSAKQIKIDVHYKNLTGVSAIHIHVSNNGMPGPVLAWLATSDAWTNGVAQNVQGANGDCCTLLNPQCTLVAPSSTPHVSSLSNTKRTFIVSKPNNNCEWLTKGTLLDIHGPNFQQKINGKLTKGVPGMDIIAQSTFVRV